MNSKKELWIVNSKMKCLSTLSSLYFLTWRYLSNLIINIHSYLRIYLKTDTFIFSNTIFLFNTILY